MFLGPEYAMVTWEARSSSIVSFSVSSFHDGSDSFFQHVIFAVSHVHEYPIGAAEDVLRRGVGGRRKEAVRQDDFSL